VVSQLELVKHTHTHIRIRGFSDDALYKSTFHITFHLRPFFQDHPGKPVPEEIL